MEKLEKQIGRQTKNSNKKDKVLMIEFWKKKKRLNKYSTLYTLMKTNINIT